MTTTPASAALSLSATADRLIFGVLVGAAVLAAAIGWTHGQLTTALVVAGLLVATGGAALALLRGTLASRLLLSTALMAMVALHIQVGRGTLEYHFGVFITLGLLLVYRDWRPQVAAAALIAVHHVVFDRLQAAGVGVYCMAEANFMMVLVHAGYVVVQTAFNIFLAQRMRQAANTGEELGRMVDHLNASRSEVALDISQVQVASPLGGQLKDTLLRMNSALCTVRNSIGSIQTASGEIASGSADLSHRTEQTAGSLQQTASAMAQLTGSVRQSSEAAAQANQLAASAVQAAQRGGTVVAQVVTNMDDISAASSRIADILGTINDIAFQTNILALNAAVEAARAGEQGRGFAVVASEVRSLAQRSAAAAQEIKALIGDSAEKVASGSRLVQEAGQNMGEIVAGIQRVGDIIAEITAAAGEQHSGISAVNQAVRQLDGMTQQNAALVEQSAAAAESLQNQAAQLAQVIQRFRLSADAAGQAGPA